LIDALPVLRIATYSIKEYSMKIVMLGSGNVATHLGRALYGAGHSVLQVWSRNEAHAQELAEQLKAEATDQLQNVTTEGDLYIISVLDDAIVPLLNQLPPISATLVH